VTKSEWFDLLHDHWDDLKALVMSCHPRADYQLREDMPITAPAAEQACETVRRQLSAAGEPVTEQLLQQLKDSGDADGLYSLLSGAWFGVPESTSCWRIPGFGVLCSLLEDPPKIHRRRKTVFKRFIAWLQSWRWVEVSRKPETRTVWDDGGYGWVSPGFVAIKGWEITEYQPATGKQRVYWEPEEED